MTAERAQPSQQRRLPAIRRQFPHRPAKRRLHDFLGHLRIVRQPAASQTGTAAQSATRKTPRTQPRPPAPCERQESDPDVPPRIQPFTALEGGGREILRVIARIDSQRETVPVRSTEGAGELAQASRGIRGGTKRLFRTTELGTHERSGSLRSARRERIIDGHCGRSIRPLRLLEVEAEPIRALRSKRRFWSSSCCEPDVRVGFRITRETVNEVLRSVHRGSSSRLRRRFTRRRGGAETRVALLRVSAPPRELSFPIRA